MIRFFITLFISALIGRWMIAEAQLIAPGVARGIDYLMKVAEIPTHDRWDRSAIAEAVRSVSPLIEPQAERTKTQLQNIVSRKSALSQQVRTVTKSPNALTKPIATGYERF